MQDFFAKFMPLSSDKLDESSKRSSKLNWILMNQLAVGPIPLSKERQDLLIDSGIRSILTVCSESDGKLPEDLLAKVRWHRVALPDSHSSERMTETQLAEAITVAQELLQDTAPLYIHCVAGMERSPSVCVAYLCKYKGMQLWEALNWVKQANSPTNILDSQLQAIQSILK